MRKLRKLDQSISQLIFILTGCFFLSFSLKAMSLDEYLSTIKKQNKLFNALDASVEASKAKMESGDLVLEPIFNLGYSLATDKSLPSAVADKRQVNELTAGLSKKFSTGTLVKLSAITDEFNNEGAANPAMSKFSTGGLGVSLTQSLWKDFFGAGTRARRDRETSISKIEVLQTEIQKQQFLIEAETAFWNYLTAQEFRDLKKENLTRTKRIDQWTTRRVSNGISDRSDLMNVRALNSMSELLLAQAESDVKSQEIMIRQHLNLQTGEPTPKLEGNIKDSRDYFKNLESEASVIRMDSYIQYLSAQAKRLVAEEVRDNLRPDLTLTGAYNTSSYDPSYNEMVKGLDRTDRPKTYIGLNFIYMFDTGAKSSQLTAADKDALAAKYLAERALQQGRDSWEDHKLKYNLAKNNLTLLEKTANYQRERAKAEQDKLSKGRTTTFAVVNAETEAAEAELNFLKAKSGLRQLEASSQLFTPFKE